MSRVREIIMTNHIATTISKFRNSKKKEKLRNQNFTILSSNCIGGVIYHKLGLRFLSPTINLWFKPNDFLKFIENLEYYLKTEILIESRSSNLGYPVGILGEGDRKIYLYFQHYNSFDEAKRKWNSRKKRVNLENLFIIMTDRDGADEEDLKEFDQLCFKNKIVLTGKEYPNIKSALLMNGCVENGHLGNVFKTNFLTGKSKLDDFDFVSFLNNDN